jgi:hypothetical protein
VKIVVRLALISVVLGSLVPAATPHAQRSVTATSVAAAESTFAARVARLSEQAGYFDSDNLISNESSYLHPVSALRGRNVTGGAYIGVGPDQSFSYIAAIRPRVAYIIDIRRDNMLQHLMFKALFARSRNRMEFLCRWLGYDVPTDVARWSGGSIEAIVAKLDSMPPNEGPVLTERAAVLALVRSFGVPLDERDLATVQRFHAEFQRERLDLRFTSHGRPPRAGYPTLRDLILEKDLTGRLASYLASESDWQFVKTMQENHLIIPVVGDLAGPHALRAIGKDIAALGTQVSALYVSNVEQYLWRDGTFEQFADNAIALPRNARSVLIRSYFGRNFGSPHPLARDGGASLSTQLMQTLSDFSDRRRQGAWGSYWDLVTLGAIDMLAASGARPR